MTEFLWSRMTAAALRELAGRDAVVLLPVASTEQHGPHLATGVDAVLCGEACLRAARLVHAAGMPVVVAPTLWCGLADHHVEFGGTFTLSFATYYALLRDLCRSIIGAGFRRIALINGHGGNIAGLATAVVELRRELGVKIATATYFMDGREAAAGVLEDQHCVMHACEAETSMMLAAAPDLVDRARLADAYGPPSDLVMGTIPTLKAPQTFKEKTPSGVAGDARRASTEKGEALLEIFATALAQRVVAGAAWG